MKKWTSVLSMSAVALSLFTGAAVADANATTPNNEERQQIFVAITDEEVTKEKLVNKLKSVLPEMFSSFSNSDFQMSTMSHHYADDLTTRYDLSYSKMVNNKMQSGSITFSGDDLLIESISMYPNTTKDALFPGKITEQQAKTIATDFVKKVSGSSDFIIQSEIPSYYSTRIITEPITYTYSFVKTEKNIPIQDQGIYVSILGDGNVQYYSQYRMQPKRQMFEDTANVMAKDAAVAKLKEEMKLSLQYAYDYMSYSSTPKVSLVYAPATNFNGVHAKTGKWHNYMGETTQTQAKPLTPIVDKPLQQPKAITLDEAKEIAKKLVEARSNGEKFTIDSAYEHEYNGSSVISISYSYHMKNMTHGTSIEFDKKTGELTNYYDLTDSLPYIDAPEDTTPRLAEDKVVAIALDYAKQFAPASIHEYSKPIYEIQYNEEDKMHYVTFPRIKNGILVNGDNISVSINNKGELKSYYRSHLTIEEWPDKESVISLEEAQQKFDAALSAKLVYNAVYKEEGKYELLYVPTINDEQLFQMDAQTGEILNAYGTPKKETITHKTAEKELNYLIQAGAIEVKNAKDFNADKAISQGDALKTIVKSIGYFYEGYSYYRGQNATGFDLVPVDHPYYSTVESAYRMGIIKAEDNLAIDQNVTKEQVAVWFVRALGLEQAAKKTDIYKLNVADAADITPAYTGYVALSQALNLQKLSQNNFQPKKEVTYADLAVSIIDLAYAIADKQNTGY